MADRFKNPASAPTLVIVRDMWLTGFDVPCLHTMYVDKPMRGHGLVQAIARVNRVFGTKPGGLVVDYLGLAAELKEALAQYTEGDRKMVGISQEDAVAAMLEKYEIVTGLFHGFDYPAAVRGTPQARLKALPPAMEHILRQEDGKPRFLDAMAALSKAFALAVPHEKAMAIRDELAFFQAVRAAILKATPRNGKSPEDLDAAIQQIVSRAVSSTEVVDILSAAGLKKPDLSILSEEFLGEMRGLAHKNLAVEVLRKLLNDEIRSLARRNLVQSRSFAEMLERAIRQYHNRTVEAVQVLEELIALATPGEGVFDGVMLEELEGCGRIIACDVAEDGPYRIELTNL
ncbi:MAG: type I restriction enzyme endonuclease domain-containing protein, partial [bacterium]